MHRLEFSRVPGYWDTLSQNALAGDWMPVNTSAPSMVVLQQNAVMMGFGAVEQCAVIGQSLDSFSGS